ncbi:hypothetical protein [uncultured Desulfovibrio sp.]|uniref:hypothetical protein n=1 Tax=uncultured Desulfovibrio sp. TaxID=167968 RepID=UPI002588E033|nr:hypothetical protein [uncultured Desulfovibrio sp.]
MKKTRSQRKRSEAARTNATANSPTPPPVEEKRLSESEKVSFLLSLYSLTSSNFYSALNILASIVVVANSALAFAAISRGWIGLFSAGSGIYLFSLVFYGLAAYSNFLSKKEVYDSILNKDKDILKLFDSIEKNSKYFSNFIIIFVVISVIFFAFIDYIITK